MDKCAVKFDPIYGSAIASALARASISFSIGATKVFCEAGRKEVLDAFMGNVSSEGYIFEKELDPKLSLEYPKNMKPETEVQIDGVPASPITPTVASVATTPAKKGSGRQKGSYSFASVPLSILIAKLKPEMNVKCGRVWLESLGITDAVSAKASEVCSQIPVAETPEVPVQLEVS
jgi:hypothetical protein